MAPIGVALIGGGIFAKMEHMPGTMKCSSLRLRAIHSRSLKSAKDTAALDDKGQADLYSSDSGQGKSFEDLLLRQDISAVIIALPISAQPEFIEKALKAGKHVLAEKPIAPDVTTAKKLIETASQNGVTVSIAENYRFMPKFAYAAEQAKRLGKVNHSSVRFLCLLPPDNLWYSTPWRGQAQYQGGPLLDGGVHYAAATRLFLQDESKVASVSALTSLTQEHLPPADTVNALVKTKPGTSGTVQFSFGSHIEASEWDCGLDRGTVKLSGDTVTVKLADGEAVAREFPHTSGVSEEIVSWAEGLVSGKPNSLQSAEEGMADVEFVEVMLKSAEKDGVPMKFNLQ